ncbi:MAG: Recombination protein RecR [Parcubacteria group bacterium GW2011_GWA2_47_7]|nr:MAG: Recombination protein RecR [Parcubacteria group bacterium GW2011_GWA2_47_7]
MDPISRLAALFAEFPGIGGRQSKRFVHYLLKRDRAYLNELARQISSLQEVIFECERCHRYFQKKHAAAGNACVLCTDTERDHKTLMIVEKDSDLEALERSGTYKGVYFVLGGSLPILEKDPNRKIRINALLDRIQSENDNLDEVIIACAVTPESEHTAEYVVSNISSLLNPTMTQITHLGRGLSTGTELEYSDADTLRYALEGRK